MIRIIRTSTLDALRADSAALPAVREELDQAKAAADLATDSAIRTENAVERLLRDCSQAHADRVRPSAHCPRPSP